MKKVAAIVLLLLAALPALAKTHKETYNVSCKTLWPAVKDTLRNSGKYGVLSIDNEDMAASYNIGGTLSNKRTNSVMLNPQGNNCEMQIQTAFSGLTNSDESDFKKRVDASLAKLQTSAGAPDKPADAKPDDSAKQ